MKTFIIEVLLKQVLKLLGMISDAQWEKVKEYVQHAAVNLLDKSGSEKREYVVSELKKLWGDTAPALLNLLVESAVALLRAQAKI